MKKPISNEKRGRFRYVRELTLAEKTLWEYLQRYDDNGAKFTKLERIGDYTVTFANIKEKMIIELNGAQLLADKIEKERKDAWFKSQGYKVLRFWDNDVLKNVNGVLEYITKRLL